LGFSSGTWFHSHTLGFIVYGFELHAPCSLFL
jgi:hypothetical protein